MGPNKLIALCEKDAAMTILTRSHSTLGTSRRRGVALSRILDVWRQRQHLQSLDAAALDDIGLSRKDATREANRPIWDVPAHWRS